METRGKILSHRGFGTFGSLASVVVLMQAVKDTETLLTCCQQADTQTLLAVMAEERKRHEHPIARAANGNQIGSTRSSLLA